MNDDVLLQECPPIYTMVLVILAGALGLGGYLGRKMQHKRKGKAPKLQATYFKVSLLIICFCHGEFVFVRTLECVGSRSA